MTEKTMHLESWKLMMCTKGYVDENGDCETPDGIMKACDECRYYS